MVEFLFFKVIQFKKMENCYKIKIQEYHSNKVHERLAIKASTEENNNVYIFKYLTQTYEIEL